MGYRQGRRDTKLMDYISKPRLCLCHALHVTKYKGQPLCQSFIRRLSVFIKPQRRTRLMSECNSICDPCFHAILLDETRIVRTVKDLGNRPSVKCLLDQNANGVAGVAGQYIT